MKVLDNLGKVSNKLLIFTLIFMSGVAWQNYRNPPATVASWNPESGWAKQTYDNGKLKAMAEFTEGSVTRLKQWQENGRLMWDIGYAKGKVRQSDVPFESCWDSNFSLHDGLFTKWYGNGRKEEEVNYKDGKMDGLFSKWHENGLKWSEENFKDGDFDGTRNFWYENGQKDQEQKWKDDKFMFCQTWKPNGEKCPETNLKDGNGRSVCYHPNGQKWWDENWKNGKRDGPCTLWYENGQKELEENWKDGELDGLLINYDEDGTEILRETYMKGKLVKD